MLERVGLEDAAYRRVGGFSLGTRQRLGIAGAMLGDSATCVFDEPANGLDTDGVRWFRNLVRGPAAEGRTVFLSSHLISEVELSADHVIVLGRGRVLADAPLVELRVLPARRRPGFALSPGARLLAKRSASACRNPAIQLIEPGLEAASAA